MIKRITSSIGLMLRVLKNALLRPVRAIRSHIDNIFSAGRVANAVPGAVKGLPKALKRKPEKREDYFDWGRIYVAKSLVLVLSIVIIAVPLLWIFLLNPLFTSLWWVRDFNIGDEALKNYSGKVRIFYDEQRESLQFEGRLKDGNYEEYGEEHWENGRYKYVGNYLQGVFSGSGILYNEDGSVLYRGDFAQGKYDGSGELSEDGLTYSGEFSGGILQGSGVVTKDGVTLYTGGFTDGLKEGTGKENYPSGKLHYTGTFSAGLPQGSLLEYYENGTLKYNGGFVAGKYSGNGTLYSESGEKLYSGGFELGEYSGTGTLYSSGKKLYSGEFESGAYCGSGTLYGSDGTVTAGTFDMGVITGAAVRTYPDGTRYEGCFSGGAPGGVGVLTDAAGNEIYSGQFMDGDIDLVKLVQMESQAAAELFPTAERTVETSGFWLEDGNGTAIRCSFAQGDSPASVQSVYEKPVGGTKQYIKSAGDIYAPSAANVTEVSGAVLPAYAQRLGIPEQEVKCYSADYSGAVLYWWTDTDGLLLMRSCVRTDSVTVQPDESTPDTGLSDDEIKQLFEDIGLDIADFESLGF